jgi:hypothetical protein
MPTRSARGPRSLQLGRAGGSAAVATADSGACRTGGAHPAVHRDELPGDPSGLRHDPDRSCHISNVCRLAPAVPRCFRAARRGTISSTARRHCAIFDLNGHLSRRRGCPGDRPSERQKRALQSQRQLSRPLGDVVKREGLTKKNKDGRKADRRLANRRLQPLGHLTADFQVYGTQTPTRKRSTAKWRRRFAF